MKFSKDDPIRLKKTNEEGKFVSYIDKETAYVIVNKLKIPVLVDDIEHPYLAWFLASNKKENEKKSIVNEIKKDLNYKKETGKANGIFLNFFPQYSKDEFDEKIEKIKIYFINETTHSYRFSYQVFEQETLYFELESELRDYDEFYLHDLSFEVMAHSPIFKFSFARLDDTTYNYQSNYVLKPKKLFQHLETIKKENVPFFKILLIDKIEKRKQETIAMPTKTIFTSNTNQNRINIYSTVKHTVDLHIEKLNVHHQQLSSEEKLKMQLDEFEKQLDLAIALHQAAIVFVHGVGKGILKNKIHKALDEKKKLRIIKSYSNDYTKEHGFGATEVKI